MFLNTLKSLTDKIFRIKTDAEFKELTLAIFHFQATNNPIYSQYVNSLKIDVGSIKELEGIPFLPIEFFKTLEISTKNQVASSKYQDSKIFLSSGTSGMIQSKHSVADVSIYEKSYLNGFKHFYGNIEEYCFLALLPSYLERDGSSLIYMANDLIKKSKHSESGFYLNNYDELISMLNSLEAKKQKTILLGVTYALLNLIEKQNFNLKYTIIMETGGMKGKRKEMIREELHTILCKGFGVNEIHSEYGMTELLSQAYSKENGIFDCPPWMKIMIRDTNDPFSFLSSNKTGGINVIDLANIYSCSFIASQDLGRINPNNSFEVLGRFDNSDIRGCNLMVE